MSLSEILEQWYEKNKRDLPWRSSGSAYHIWLSEIILQQTRVNQGLAYYNRFISAFPGVANLAAASIDDVLKLWQGLGYYNRAVNMHHTAKLIVSKYKGVFPEEYEKLLKLKGIGTYTAAAIASIAFKKPVAVVDGNVSRVISRLYAIEDSIDSLKGRKIISQLAHDLLNRAKPHIHNQAMMEFGALVCLPRNPLCPDCVFLEYCEAYARGKTRVMPVKSGKTEVRSRFLHYIFLVQNKHTWLNQRNTQDIWKHLFEFPMIETDHQCDFNGIVASETWGKLIAITDYKILDNTRIYKHRLTHQLLHCSFTMIAIEGINDFNSAGFRCVPLHEIVNFAVPRVIERYLEDLRNKGLL
jgi:A/G-specific adenine glycosylase